MTPAQAAKLDQAAAALEGLGYELAALDLLLKSDNSPRLERVRVAMNHLTHAAEALEGLR